uniref:Uncharacterized protein n=1 Tax=Roseihalotalea indica TaxID=2867963 RepID=A0AA49JD83_9BACT|nr:hypothetical protein K4G66_29430 [Tunicatimonas sp. TK19036]
MKRIILLLLILITTKFAEAQNFGNQAITYEELYDDPYAINKFFLHLQPLYADVFATNVNAGFGIAANYYMKDKADFHANFRQAYTRSFDLARDAAIKNKEIMNTPNNFTYFELGGTYHIKDEESDTETKLILYSRKYAKGNRWASHVPEHTVVPSKVRKVIGVRAGGFAYDTSIDLKRITQDQNVSLVDEAGEAFPSNRYVFTNEVVTGGYIGGSMSWIKNMAIKPDKGYGVLVDDLILTTYLDIMIAPSIALDTVQYRDPNLNNSIRKFSSDVVETKFWGFRLGLDGKYNRELGWAYGAELGARPGIKGRGFYAMLKISIPVFSTNMDHSREAFGK